MEEKNQKTIVAFIAGLLIGGLLVWVFFVASGDDVADETRNDTPATETRTDGANNSASVSTAGDNTPEEVTVSENGEIRIADQKAGMRVAIESFKASEENGWIAIHDVNSDESLGRVLGAARFALKEGLVPQAVELLRPTIAGKTYRVVLYGEDGDKRFATKDGVLKNGDNVVEDSFKAE